MPHVKPKANARVRGNGRAGISLTRSACGLDRSAEASLVQNGETTHVLLPVEEYERLCSAVEAQELAALAEDPHVKWIPAEDAALELAGVSIAEARQEAGLTQKQLADRMGVPQSQISRIEKNPDRSTVRTMKRIAKALGVDMSAMLRFASRSTR